MKKILRTPKTKRRGGKPRKKKVRKYEKVQTEHKGARNV